MKTKKIKTIFIQGMHCPSCKLLLESEFQKINGVDGVEVSLKANKADISYSQAKPDFNSLHVAARKFGYDISESKFNSDSSQDKPSFQNKEEWTNAVLIVLALFTLYFLFIKSGLANRLNFNQTNVSFAFAFVTGIAASISSCLVVVGAIVIGFAEKFSSKDKNFFNSAVKPNMLFQAGRLITFFFLGGLLGAVGGKLNISNNFISLYTIFIAIILGWLGLNILKILPSFSKINPGIRLPINFKKHWNSLQESKHKLAPFILGGLTFFLPCGFTQSMQLFALASGSFLRGGMILLFFSLGTMPILITLGITASWTKKRSWPAFQKAIGILIIFFALYSLNSGLAMRGLNFDFRGIFRKEPANEIASSTGQIQIIKMSITSFGYQPGEFRLKNNIPVKWIINGDQATGCTNKIIVPSLNISKNITKGENIIEFTPRKTGKIIFSCGMGMVTGEFIVQ